MASHRLLLVHNTYCNVALSYCTIKEVDNVYILRPWIIDNRCEYISSLGDMYLFNLSLRLLTYVSCSHLRSINAFVLRFGNLYVYL